MLHITLHFFELQSDFIYDHHSDLFGRTGDPSLEQIVARVIGREIKKTIIGNHDLLERLVGILEVHLKQKEKSGLIRNMVNESDSNVEVILQLLVALLEGVNE